MVFYYYNKPFIHPKPNIFQEPGLSLSLACPKSKIKIFFINYEEKIGNVVKDIASKSQQSTS